MTINPRILYEGAVDEDVPGYPWGMARNSREGAPGTPFDKNWLNCHWGATQSLLRRAGLAPNGRPDSRNDSQFLEAIELLARAAVEEDRRRFDLAGLVPINRVAGPRSLRLPKLQISNFELRSVTMSPDGRRVFGLWADGRCAQVELLQPGIIGPNIRESYGGGFDLVGPRNLEDGVVASSLVFRPDGRRYWVCLQEGRVVSRGLRDPWDIRPSSTIGAVETAAELVAVDLAWSSDGRRAVAASAAGGELTSLTPLEPYALGAVTESTTLSVPQLQQLTGIAVSPDGRNVVVAGRGEVEPHRTLVQFHLDVPWDVSSAVYSNTMEVSNSRLLLDAEDSSVVGNCHGISWRSDGAALLVAAESGLALQLEAVEVVA